MGTNLQDIVLVNSAQPPGCRKKGERLRISKMFEKIKKFNTWRLAAIPNPILVWALYVSEY